MRYRWRSFARPVTESIESHIPAGQGQPVPTLGPGIGPPTTSRNVPPTAGSVGHGATSGTRCYVRSAAPGGLGVMSYVIQVVRSAILS